MNEQIYITVANERAMESLSYDFHALKCMTTIMVDLLEEIVDYRRENAPDGVTVMITCDREDIELIAFSWNEVLNRVAKLKDDFANALNPVGVRA